MENRINQEGGASPIPIKTPRGAANAERDMTLKNQIKYVSRYFEQDGESYNEIPSNGHFERIVCLDISTRTLDRITFALERFIETNDDASRILLTADIIQKLYRAREKSLEKDI